MSTFFKGSQKSSPQQRTGFSCSTIILKKLDRIADAIGWSRNALISASIIHIIRIIDDKSYDLIPDVVILARVLKKLNRCNLCIEEVITNAPIESEQPAQLQSTALTFNPVILKKIDAIVLSIGWSRNLFIVESIIHLIKMIDDSNYNYAPNVVQIARAVIYGDKILLKIPVSDSD